MADLSALVRKGVALIDKRTKSLHVPIQHKPWTGMDRYGKASYGSTQTYKAIEEQEVRLHETKSGRAVMTRAKVTILETIPPNGTSGRDEPVDSRDKIILSDGTSGPIVDIVGMTDPSTTRPYFVEVWIGMGNTT